MSMFKGPKAPPPPGDAPPPPERSNDEIQAAAAEQRKRFGGGQGGRANTVFTGGLGVSSSDVYSAGTRLLGGGS
jgi:hypothetical protein